MKKAKATAVFKVQYFVQKMLAKKIQKTFRFTNIGMIFKPIMVEIQKTMYSCLYLPKYTFYFF